MRKVETAVRFILGIENLPIIIEFVPYISHDSKGRFSFEKPRKGAANCNGIFTVRRDCSIILLSKAECRTKTITESTLAHELIHAWQSEKLTHNRLRHGKRDFFQQWGDFILQELGIAV